MSPAASAMRWADGPRLPAAALLLCLAGPAAAADMGRSPVQLAAASLLCLAGPAAAVNTGRPECPCIEHMDFGSAVSGGHLQYRPAGSSVTYNYPADLGLQRCEAWEDGLDPHCNRGARNPRWCSKKWCYVDRARCDGMAMGYSIIVMGATWSYQTCGSSTSSADWLAAVAGMNHLLTTMEGHLMDTRDSVERAFLTLSRRGCTMMGFCNNVEAYVRNGAFRWSDKLDFHQGAWSAKMPLSGAEDTTLGRCLGKSAADSYLKIGTSEALETAQDRGGFLYFGDQASGSFAQWPGTDWCPSEFDSRKRPWYAAGSSGPKDVIIILDVSGSMRTSNRHSLARQAVKTLLRTLVWKDFATIILFNHGISALYSEVLRPVDEATREQMMNWVDDQNFKSGGTDFQLPMEKAFEIIRASTEDHAVHGHTEVQSSMCQKAIMFLTDGQAAFTETDFENLRRNSLRYNAVVFAYTIGSTAEAAIAIPKRMACENRGVYYKVPDGGDLDSIMARYFEYFAQGQHVCTPSFIEYRPVGTTLPVARSGCLPVYDRSSGRRKLLGVTCIDAGILADPWTMHEQQGWEMAVCKMSDITKMCRPLELQDCDLQKIRAEYDDSSICPDFPGAAPPSRSAVRSAVCDCVDPSCRDDPNFIDEKNYFCDTWIGDDCSQARALWGYTARGQRDVLDHCRRSCGICDWVACTGQAPPCEEDSTQLPACRKCTGAIVTGVDFRGCRMSCPTMDEPTCPAAVTYDGGGAAASGGASVGAIVGGIAAVVIILGGVAYWLRSHLKKGGARPRPSPVQPVVQAAAASTVVIGIRDTARSGPQIDRKDMVPLPQTWRNQDLDTNFSTLEPVPEMIEVFQKMLSETFKKVTTRDRRGGPLPDRLKVTMVSRIENRDLFQQYAFGKRRIEGKRPHKCTPLANTRGGDPITHAFASKDLKKDLNWTTNEVLLFHGTSPQGAQGISRDGFRLSYAGTAAGSMYGNGIYLAECSSKSDEYAKDDTDGLYKGLFCLLLCRANLGEILTMTAGGDAVHDMVRSAMDNGAYDSVLGDREASVGTYREFITYQEDQVLPEYVIFYMRQFK